MPQSFMHLFNNIMSFPRSGTTINILLAELFATGTIPCILPKIFISKVSSQKWDSHLSIRYISRLYLHSTDCDSHVMSLFNMYGVKFESLCWYCSYYDVYCCHLLNVICRQQLVSTCHLVILFSGWGTLKKRLSTQ